MSYWLRVKTDSGFKMVESVDPASVEPIELNMPSSTTIPGAKSTWKCSLCDKQLPTAGVSAMHFSKAHRDYDKTEWRKYIKQ